MLFYSTEIGKKAIVRQLQPHVHLDGQLSLSLCLCLSLPSLSPHLPSVADPLLCESLSQFVSFMIQVSPSSGDRPVLGYPVTPSSSSAGRVYPWYIVPAMSRLEEIQPLVGDQNKKK
jgi:hypothetical protein